MEDRISKLEDIKDQVIYLIESLEEDFKRYLEMEDAEETEFITEGIDSLKEAEEGLQNAWSSLVALE